MRKNIRCEWSSVFVYFFTLLPLLLLWNPTVLGNDLKDPFLLSIDIGSLNDTFVYLWGLDEVSIFNVINPLAFKNNRICFHFIKAFPMFFVRFEKSFVYITIWIQDFTLTLEFIFDKLTFVVLNDIIRKGKLPASVLFVISKTSFVNISISIMKNPFSFKFSIHKRPLILFL